MNLADYQKVAATFFGECPGCDGCDACRIQTLVASVWESGRRSGASSSAERKKQSTTWEEWGWSEAHEHLLITYAIEKCADGVFTQPGAARAYVREQLERAELWTGGRDKVVRKIDWVKFMKTWILRDLSKMPALPTPTLFDQPSQVRSVPSKAAARESVLQESLNMRRRKGARSQLRTS